MTITLLDVILLAVMLLSAALAMVRGFTREVLSIASWVAATLATLYFFEPARTLAREHIKFNPPQIADVIAAGGIFIVTLLLVSFITMKISDAILDSRIGPLDRTLGFVFGAGRGLLLVVIAFLFFSWLVPEKGQPDWFRTSQSKPLLQSAGDQLLALLPEDPESTILQRLKPKPDGDGASPTAPASPDAVPPADEAPSGGAAPERPGIQNLLDRDARPNP